MQVVKRVGVNQRGVEGFGGAVLNPWFERDLSLAGQVSFKTDQGAVSSALVDFKRPMAIIPALAIHLDREANESKSVNAQNHLPAIISLETDQSFHELFKAELSEKGVDEILSFDLLLYDTQAAI